MEKKKQTYESPDMTEIRVELESSICSGSVDIMNPDDAKYGRIEEQKINQDFDGDAFDNGTWG